MKEQSGSDLRGNDYCIVQEVESGNTMTYSAGLYSVLGNVCRKNWNCKETHVTQWKM